HFSGVDPANPDQVSKYCDRIDPAALGAAGSALFADYRDRVLKAGYAQARGWPYVYGRFRGGPRIPDFYRAYFRAEVPGNIAENIAPFDPKSGSPSVFQMMEGPVDGMPLTGCALALYRSDASLQKQFPHVPGRDAEAFGRWFAADVWPHLRLDRVFIDAE